MRLGQDCIVGGWITDLITTNNVRYYEQRDCHGYCFSGNLKVESGKHIDLSLMLVIIEEFKLKADTTVEPLYCGCLRA